MRRAARFEPGPAIVFNFDTTLFADDSYLSLSSNSLLDVNNKVNRELATVDKLLPTNKLGFL